MNATLELWTEGDNFLNCKQAAAFLGMSQTTFYRIRRSKGISCYYLGGQPKFKIDDLIAYRESQRVEFSGKGTGPPVVGICERVKLPRR